MTRCRSQSEKLRQIDEEKKLIHLWLNYKTKKMSIDSEFGSDALMCTRTLLALTFQWYFGCSLDAFFSKGEKEKSKYSNMHLYFFSLAVLYAFLRQLPACRVFTTKAAKAEIKIK